MRPINKVTDFWDVNMGHRFLSMGEAQNKYTIISVDRGWEPAVYMKRDSDGENVKMTAEKFVNAVKGAHLRQLFPATAEGKPIYDH